MLRCHTDAGADMRDHRERHLRAAAGHVVRERGLVHQRIQAHADKVDEHQLGDRPEARHRGADRGAQVAHLRDRRIQHAVRAELGVQSLVLGEGAAPGF